MIRRIALLTTLVCAGLLPVSAFAASIAVSGSFSTTVDANDLTAGAGSNFTTTYSSAANAVLLDITSVSDSNGNGNLYWRTDIKRTDTTWNGSLSLKAQRTGTGSGTNCSSANYMLWGTSYQTIGTTNSFFFRLKTSCTSIPIQLQLTGMSLAVPKNTYITTVTFTISDE